MKWKVKTWGKKKKKKEELIREDKGKEETKNENLNLNERHFGTHVVFLFIN